MFQIKFAATLFCLIGIGVQATGAPIMTVELPMAQPLAVAYSPDGKQIAIGGIEAFGSAPIDGVVQLVDASNGALQPLLRHPGTIVDKDGSGSSGSQNRILSLAYSVDGKTLAVAADFGLKLWNPIDGQELVTLLGYGIDERSPVRVTSVEFSPDGKLLAVARLPVELWDATARKPLRQIDVHGDTHVRFFKDGARLASASFGNEVHLWNVADGKEMGRIHAEMGPLYGVAIDPQEGHLAAVGEGGEKLWKINEAASGEWRFVDEVRLRGHMMSPVRQVAFSSDGRWLATAGDDGALVLYDASTQQIIGTLLAGGPFALSQDRKSMAVAQFRDDRRSSSRAPGTQPKGGTRLTVWKVDDLLNANRLSEQARAAAAEMVQTLTAPNPNRRLIQGVVAVLSGPQAEAATPILVAALANPAVKEKQLLLFPLGRIAVHDAKARTALIEALRSNPDVDVRSMAAGMLAELPKDVGKEAVPALVEAALNDESPHVSSSAARALQRLDPAAYKTVTEKLQARGPVVAKVEHRDRKLFYQGRSLEEWIKRLSVSYIPNEIYGRPRPDEPLAAIRAIGAEAVPMLVDTLKSDKWPLRQAAAAGLKALDPQAVDPVFPLLGTIAAAQYDTDVGATCQAADRIAVILKDRKELMPQLVELTKSNIPAVRLGAARAVAQIDSKHPRALPVLKTAMEATSPETGLHPTINAPMLTAPFSDAKQPSISWLEKKLTDEEAPALVRIRAAATLGSMKAEAIAALAAMIKALSAQDPGVAYQTMHAIQEIGPQAIPAVKAALKTETDARARMRLAAAMWKMGEEGQNALQDLLMRDDAESLWWAVAVGKREFQFAISYQHAARESLKKCGQEVPPLQDVRDSYFRRSASFFKTEKPDVAWEAKVLVDEEAPLSLRKQAVGALLRAPKGELQPVLPALLKAIEKEQDTALELGYAEILQRMGPESIAAISKAIEASSSDNVRRILLRALNGLGKEGQQEVERLKQRHPELSKLVLEARVEPAMTTVERLRRMFANVERYTAFDVSTSGGAIPPAVTSISLVSVRCFLLSKAKGPPYPTSTPDSLHQCSGAHPLPDGTRVKWSCRTKNGREFTQVTIDSVTYDLAKGRVFLLSKKEGAINVHQVATGPTQAHGSGMQELKNLEKDHPEIREFLTDRLSTSNTDSNKQAEKGPTPSNSSDSRQLTPAFQVIKMPAKNSASGASVAERAIERIPISIATSFAPVDMVVGATSPADGSIRLTTTRPAELIKEPKYQGQVQKYGQLRLGTREDKLFHLVYDVLDDNIVGLYFDRNQNRDLTDDDPLKNQGTGQMATAIAIPLQQVIPELKKSGNFSIWLFTNKQQWQMGRASHYSRTQLKGRVNIAGNSYLAYIGETGANGADFTNDGIYIDLNNDGKIQSEEEYISSEWTIRGDSKEYSFDIQW